MTDRVQSLTVYFEEDMRSDDAQTLVDAISMLRNVAKVELGQPVTGNDHFARERIRRELLLDIYEMIKAK